MKTTTKVSYTIDDEKEQEVLRHCLNYCWHRLTKHPECGLKMVSKITLERLRKELSPLQR